MTPDLLLGLDAGNTVIKAVLFDPYGRPIASHALDGASVKPAPGMVERSVPELWANAQAVIAGCVRGAGIDPGRIAAVGMAGHGNGLYLLDRASEPLIGIQSIDTRGAAVAAELDQTAGADIHAICLQRPWPAQTPVILAWLKRHRPEMYARAGTLLFAKDVLGFHLTGRFFSEVSDMSGAGLLRLPDARYDTDLLRFYGVPEAEMLLPPLHLPTDIVGTVTDQAAALTGLKAGTPVVAGYFDCVAAALGAGAATPGDASIIVGTWSINQAIATAPVRDDRVFMVSTFGPGRFVNMENSATSAANLEWYARTLVERDGHDGDPFAFINNAVGAIQPAPDDPLFHPFLYGGRLGAHQRGGFHAVAGWHQEGHLLRAILEGVMFEHRRHIGVLAEAGVTFSRAALSGGGARSPHWPQMFADGLNVPVTVPEARETGALGAAIAAAVGAGLYPDEQAAVAAMVRPAQTLSPDPQRSAAFDRRYALWQRLTAAMEPIWTEMAGAAP